VVRTTLGAEVETTVTVAGSEELDLITAFESGSVPPLTAENTTITAPSGFIFEVLSAKLLVGAISGAGGNLQRISVRSGGGEITYTEAESKPTSQLLYNAGYWPEADVSSEPAAPGDQTAAVRGIRIDDTVGITLRYNNRTDTAQTGRREYELLVRKIQVTE